MIRRLLVGAAAALVAAGGFAATQLISGGAENGESATSAVVVLELRVKAETTAKITFEWDAVGGAAGFRFSSSAMGGKFSHTWDGTRTEVTFAKADWYLVEAFMVGAEGRYPPPPPPTTTGSTGTTTTSPPTTTEPPPTTTEPPPTTTGPEPAATILPGQSWDAACEAAPTGALLIAAAGEHGSQSISCTKAVTIRGQGTVGLASLSIGASPGLTIESVGEYARTRVSVGTRPIVQLDVTLRDVDGNDMFVRTNGLRVFGGEYGGFNACTHAAEDGIKVWNDGNGVPSRNILFDGTSIHDIRRIGCSEHADAMQIWGGVGVTLRNVTMENCPTECLIARPITVSSDTLRDLLIDGGHYGVVLDGSQSINIGSDGELCTNILVRGTTVSESATFDCHAADGSLPQAVVPDCSRFSGSVVCREE